MCTMSESITVLSDDGKNKDIVDAEYCLEEQVDEHWMHTTVNGESVADTSSSSGQHVLGLNGSSSSCSSSNNSSRQDYRLNLTEVDSVLEAVPEDSVVPILTKAGTSLEIPPILEEEGGVMQRERKTSSGVMEARSTSSISQHPLNLSQQPLFKVHVPGIPVQPSPMIGAAAIQPLQLLDTGDDMANSECSIPTTTATTDSFACSNPTKITTMCNSDTLLTAKQQVMLWLTRTSMSDLSAVSSLWNLVHAGTGKGPEEAVEGGCSSKRRNQHCYHQHRFKFRQNDLKTFHPGNSPMLNGAAEASQTLSCNKRVGKKQPWKKRRSIIRRNYSTKSLMGGFSFICDNDLKCGDKVTMEEVYDAKDNKMSNPDGCPIRKCETVIALSRMNTGSNKTTNADSSQQMPLSHGCTSPTFESVERKQSSKSLFRKLSRVRNSYASGASMRGMTNMMAHIDSDSPYPGMQPINRLRSSSSIICSRCNSAMSTNNSLMTSRVSSQMSLLQMASVGRRISSTTHPLLAPEEIHKEEEHQHLCKICLTDFTLNEMVKLEDCCCYFCKECMAHYVAFEIMEGAYEISCPDPECEKQGILHLPEIDHMVGKELADKHRSFRLNKEIALDCNRAWCPQAGCDTICHICIPNSRTNGGDSLKPLATSVKCPSCRKEFCSLCSANWHPGKTCVEFGKELVKRSMSGTLGAGGMMTSPIVGSRVSTGDTLLLDGVIIKSCPMCHIPIERDAGCAQMMCKRCKHVFCWFCLASLDEDFLLRHYDSGACKGRLGHTRASMLWHRAQVVGIFAGFGVLLVLAAPLILIAAPCILCCNCKTCFPARVAQEDEEKERDDGAEPSNCNSGSISGGPRNNKTAENIFPKPNSLLQTTG